MSAQRDLGCLSCVSYTSMRFVSGYSRPTSSQMITQRKPMPPRSAKAERHPTTTIRKVSGGAKSAGPIALPKVTIARPNARRSAGNQGVAAETDVPCDGPSPAPSRMRVMSNARKEKTNTVATWTMAQLVASSARTVFVLGTPEKFWRWMYLVLCFSSTILPQSSR